MVRGKARPCGAQVAPLQPINASSGASALAGRLVRESLIRRFSPDIMEVTINGYCPKPLAGNGQIRTHRLSLAVTVGNVVHSNHMGSLSCVGGMWAM